MRSLEAQRAGEPRDPRRVRRARVGGEGEALLDPHALERQGALGGGGGVRRVRCARGWAHLCFGGGGASGACAHCGWRWVVCVLGGLHPGERSAAELRSRGLTRLI